MAKNKVWKINQFYGGNAIDEKLGLINQFADTSKGIDVFYKPSILRGNLKMETVETGATAAGMIDFIDASDGVTYGYGYLAKGGANTWMTLWKLTGTTWSAVGTASAGAPAEDGQVIEYKDYLYFYSRLNTIGRYGTLSSSPSYTEVWQTTTNSIVSNGAMAIQKETLYIANGNNVASWDGTTWTASTNFDLPSDWTIISLIPWGKYLIAAATSPESDTISRMFFWDTSATSWEFAKDIPRGKLIGIVNIGDTIKGVVLNPVNDSNHIGSLNVIEWTGGAVNVVWTHRVKGLTSASTNFNNNALDSKDGILYIGGVINSSTGVGGIYTYGQPVPGGQYSFNHAIDVGAVVLEHFYSIKWIGSYLYASFLDNTGTDYKTVRTDDTTDAYEDIQYDSLIFDGDKPYMKKKIERIIVNTNALPANAQVTLKYKVDRASSWTSIGIMGTTGATQMSFYGEFNEFKELQLQLTTNMSAGEGLIEIIGITTLYNEVSIPD